MLHKLKWPLYAVNGEGVLLEPGTQVKNIKPTETRGDIIWWLEVRLGDSWVRHYSYDEPVVDGQGIA